MKQSRVRVHPAPARRPPTQTPTSEQQNLLSPHTTPCARLQIQKSPSPAIILRPAARMPGGNVSARTEHSDPPRARRIPAGTKASERRPVADAALRLANPHQLFNSQSREREREFLGLELPAAPQDGSNDKAQGASGSVRRRA